MKAITTGILLAFSMSMAHSEATKPHGYLFAAAGQGEVLRLGGGGESPNADKSTSSRKATDAPEKRDAFQRPSGIRKRPTGAIFSSLDEAKDLESKEVDVYGLALEDADIDTVLDLYQEISGRSVIRSANLPQARITFKNENPMSRREALQTLDTTLAAHGIAMIISGPANMKAVAAKEAAQEAGPIVDWLPERLPDSGTFIVYIIHTKEDQLPREIAPMLQPLAKMPNSILAIDQAHILVLRDYSSNVRQMLQLIERLGPMQPLQNGKRVGGQAR